MVLDQGFDWFRVRLGEWFDLFGECFVFLYGDFWGGNVMVFEDGDVVIFDFVVYYGFCEVDFVMMEFFGGYSYSFYSVY